MFCACVLSGCGSNPFNPPIDPGGDGRVPGDTPINDSPQNLMIRFEKSYEFQDLPNYQKLLTSDFRYTFSQQADPNLVNLYPNWGFDDEVESTKHLFEGFVNSTGQTVPAASKIEMTLTSIQYGQDFTHSDSGSYYQKVVVPSVEMTIEVPPAPGSTDPTIYQIGNGARHEFYIVRGDAAVLSEGQEARSDRWYIRRWDDLSPSPTGAALVRLAGLNDVQRVAVTWGKLKGAYAH